MPRQSWVGGRPRELEVLGKPASCSAAPLNDESGSVCFLRRIIRRERGLARRRFAQVPRVRADGHTHDWSGHSLRTSLARMIAFFQFDNDGFKPKRLKPLLQEALDRYPALAGKLSEVARPSDQTL